MHIITVDDIDWLRFFRRSELDVQCKPGVLRGFGAVFQYCKFNMWGIVSLIFN